MITQELVKQWFNYENGELYWKNRTAPGSKIVIGQRAGRPHMSSGVLTGYRHVHILGKNYLTHRLIYLMFNGSLPTQIDHINGIRDDNRIENLRPATPEQNRQNAKTRKDNTTGVKGVYPCKNKFKAQVECNKIRYHVGYFDNIEDAKNAVQQKREELHKEFARNE